MQAEYLKLASLLIKRIITMQALINLISKFYFQQPLKIYLTLTHKILTMN